MTGGRSLTCARDVSGAIPDSSAASLSRSGRVRAQVGVGGFESDGELAGVAPGLGEDGAALNRGECCGR